MEGKPASHIAARLRHLAEWPIYGAADLVVLREQLRQLADDVDGGRVPPPVETVGDSGRDG